MSELEHILMNEACCELLQLFVNSYHMSRRVGKSHEESKAFAADLTALFY